MPSQRPAPSTIDLCPPVCTQQAANFLLEPISTVAAVPHRYPPPKKLHLARKFNVPANAPRAETGALDYLTEGLSPNGGRRMSTSSVGSSRAGGAGGDRDRDSLLSNQAQQQQQERDSADSSERSSGGGGGGGGGDDAASSSTRGEVRNAFVAGVWLVGHRSEGVVGCGTRGRVSGCCKFVVAGRGMGLGCVEVVLIALVEQHCTTAVQQPTEYCLYLLYVIGMNSFRSP